MFCLPPAGLFMKMFPMEYAKTFDSMATESFQHETSGEELPLFQIEYSNALSIYPYAGTLRLHGQGLDCDLAGTRLLNLLRGAI